MAYYFGFLPSAQLSQALDEAIALVENPPNTAVRLENHRNHIVRLVKKELIDVMLLQIIQALPDDSDRKPQLQKIFHTIEATTDKLLDSVLGKASNDEVMPSFQFLQDKTLLVDTAGKRRVGFKIEDRLGEALEQCFFAIQTGNEADTASNVKQLANLLSELTEACMQHFLVGFSQTLNLGMLKRTAVPVAQSMINKVADVALHKLLPQMPQAGLQRIVTHYQPLIVKK